MDQLLIPNGSSTRQRIQLAALPVASMSRVRSHVDDSPNSGTSPACGERVSRSAHLDQQQFTLYRLARLSSTILIRSPACSAVWYLLSGESATVTDRHPGHVGMLVGPTASESMLKPRRRTSRRSGQHARFVL
jgi:hypothetical protein